MDNPQGAARYASPIEHYKRRRAPSLLVVALGLVALACNVAWWWLP